MDIFERAGQQYNVDPNLLRAQMQVESGGNPNAVSPQGAQGPMQLMPATSKALGVANPFDTDQSVMGAAKLMAENLDRYGNVQQAIAAYHGGTDPANWGPKTQAYVQKVAAKYGGSMPQQQMPGLPPISAPQQGQVDPFAGLQGKASVGATAQQQVDPFAGLNNPSAPQAPAPSTAAVPAAARPPQWHAPGGFVMGLGDAIKGGVQSMAHGGAWLANKIAPNAQFTQDLNAALPQIDQTIANQEQQYQAARGGNGVDWARLGGNLAGTAPLAALAPDAAGAGLVGRTALGAGMGAASSALTPVTDASQPYAQQKLAQGITGAAVGGAAAPLTSVFGNALGGVTDAARQRLAQAGVTMTPGQMLGGAWQRTEDKLTSVPVLGDFIKNAQQRSVQSFNRATYQSALDPIGAQLPGNIGAGSAGVGYVRRQIGNVYNSIEPRANFTIDQNFVNDLSGIRNDLAQEAPGALNQFDNIVQNQITGKVAGGTVPQGGSLPIGGAMTGAQWSGTRSMIDRFARNQLRGDASTDQWALNGALGDLNSAVSDAVGRSSSPDVLNDLSRANAAYAQYKQIERAAGMKAARDSGNIFTPAQYSGAVGNGATSFQKSTNSGLNGQVAADAMDVLGSKYPDSGTVGRSLLTLGLGAAAGHAAAPGVVVPAAVGIGLGSLPYTTYGQRLAQALLMNRPAIAAPIGNAISAYGPALGAALAPGLARASQ